MELHPCCSKVLDSFDGLPCHECCFFEELRSIPIIVPGQMSVERGNIALIAGRERKRNKTWLHGIGQHSLGICFPGITTAFMPWTTSRENNRRASCTYRHTRTRVVRGRTTQKFRATTDDRIDGLVYRLPGHFHLASTRCAGN